MAVRGLFPVLLCVGWTSAGREDCYGFLGVGKKETTKKIKSAYRKLAAQMHPDKNPDDPKATEKFQDLAWCNDVLTDGKKRKIYDRGGEKAVNKEGDQPDGGFHPFFHRRQQEEDRKGNNVILPLMVTLEELYNGELIDIMRTKRTYVETGGERECNCRMEMKQQRRGNGYTLFQQRMCDKCPNVKLVGNDEELEIEIERGMDYGHQIEYFGEGEPKLDGEPGDLIVVLKLQNHGVFERRGNDLYTNLTISLEDALTGFTTTIKHLDGHIVKVQRSAISWHGYKFRILNEGMPILTDNTKFGSLIVSIDVKFPKTELMPDEAEIIHKLLSKYQKDIIPEFYNGIKFPSKSINKKSIYRNL